MIGYATDPEPVMLYLAAVLVEAIARQPAHVRDQLDAAVRDGNVSFTFGPDAATVYADGAAVADVPYAALPVD